MLALWLIAAATLDLGRAFAATHVLQNAARTAARELALRDAPWDADFETALGRVFDSDYLVVEMECLEREARNSGRNVQAQLAHLLGVHGLLLNQMLRPLMIFEQVSVGGQPQRLLRYPGALLSSGQPPRSGRLCAATEFSVGVPQINRTASRIVMHAVVEELQPGAFSLEGGTAQVPAGTVSMRLHYPFQAVGLTSWRLVGGLNRAERANEVDGFQIQWTELGEDEASTIGALDARDADGELQAYAVGPRGTIPVYAGRLGLGFQGVFGQNVRPFRRVITAQAVAPREVIEGPPASPIPTPPTTPTPPTGPPSLPF